jgi:hypothetical protein
LLFLVVGQPQHALAQVDSQRVAQLESRVSNLESGGFTFHGDQGAVLWLFGVFCALWAQTTGRNPWLWFFLGMFFNVITVLVLLSKNSNDKRQRLQPT